MQIKRSFSLPALFLLAAMLFIDLLKLFFLKGSK